MIAKTLALFIVAVICSGGLTNARAAADVNYSGHYVMADKKADRSFTLDVTQTKRRAEISFAAAMTDGSGAVPHGTGKGRVEDGVLSFDFKDNYKNEGTCTLKPGKDGFVLSITVATLADISPIHFYGTVSLRRTSGQPMKR
jgi:hypothetical protein